MNITGSNSEAAALRVIGYRQHVTPGQVTRTAKRPEIVNVLTRQGLIQPDPEWSGCLILTDEGQKALDFYDYTPDSE